MIQGHPKLHFRRGDRLWVREAHSTFNAHGQHRDDGLRWGPWGGLPTQLSPDRTRIAYFRQGFDRCRSSPWKPGIHMPRWASRLTLQVASYRVERLQALSEEDAIAEGISSLRDMDKPTKRSVPEFGVPNICAGVTARDAFAFLWSGLNAKRGYGWEANPWVVAVTFTVHHANIDTVPERIAA